MAIISHTMNFRYHEIISPRDISAFSQTQAFISDKDIQQYFEAVSQEIFQNPLAGLINDFKENIILQQQSFGIMQAELWGQDIFCEKNISLILSILEKNNNDFRFYMGISI